MRQQVEARALTRGRARSQSHRKEMALRPLHKHPPLNGQCPRRTHHCWAVVVAEAAEVRALASVLATVAVLVVVVVAVLVLVLGLVPSKWRERREKETS
jgi:hypothetical protein